jgi:hypothetical protein
MESLTFIEGNISIHDNNSLAACDVEALCNYLSDPPGIVSIYNNAVGCNDAVEIANDCGITLSCLPNGNYYFENQEEIDNFSLNYPGCQTLKGLVRISGEDITNLDGLETITTLDADLVITENLQLADIYGLNNAPGVLYSINITHNPLLSECDIQSVCDLLEDPPIYGTVIHDNNTGCNSMIEVMDFCVLITFIIDIFDLSDFIVSISPNPVIENAIITFNKPVTGPIEVRLYNTFGTCIKKQKFPIAGNKIQLEMADYIPGIYLCRIVTKNEIMTKKIIKQ